ncbi:MAG: hypothetical protein JSS66_14380 [Armatimonadetes bacterium]|nr:hypothetical protein [Armatimonadota bacterium]
MRRVWVFLALAGAATIAPAQVTSLINIPVADLQGSHGVEIGHWVTGYERSVDPRYYHYSYAVVGLGDRVEIAGATDYLGWSAWGFKVGVVDDQKRHYAVSAGIQNIRGNESSPFVVGRYDLGQVRFHAGWSRDDRQRLICGVDFPLNDSFYVAIDHSSSDGGSTWAGLYYYFPFCEDLSISANIGVPNNHDEGLQHSFGLFYNFKF